MCAALLCAALAVVMCACSQQEPAYDFLNVKWGFTRSQVEKSQQSEYLFASDDLMMFEGTFEDEPVEIYYSFSDDGLNEVMCSVVTGERTIAQLIEDYLAIREKLTAQYGEPLDPDYRVWINRDSEFANDAEHLLIYHQLMKYETVWRTGTSEITLTFEFADTRLNLSADAVPLPEGQQ